MTANFLSRIYYKIKCPLTSSIVTFVIFFSIIVLLVNVYTSSSDYFGTILENKINSKMKHIAKSCREGYHVSFITLKNREPKKFAFKEIVSWNKYSKSVMSIKYHNPSYQKEYIADNNTFNLFKNLPTGATYFPTNEDLKKYKIFTEILGNSNTKLDKVGLSLVKYFNGNVRFVFIITSSKGSNKCSNQDITEYLKQLIDIVEVSGHD